MVCFSISFECRNSRQATITTLPSRIWVESCEREAEILIVIHLHFTSSCRGKEHHTHTHRRTSTLLNLYYARMRHTFSTSGGEMMIICTYIHTVVYIVLCRWSAARIAKRKKYINTVGNVWGERSRNARNKWLDLLVHLHIHTYEEIFLFANVCVCDLH